MMMLNTGTTIPESTSSLRKNMMVVWFMVGTGIFINDNIAVNVNLINVSLLFSIEIV